MTDFTKADLLIIIQGLDIYNIECAKMFSRITDPYINDKEKVLRLEEFDKIHSLIGEVRKKALEQYRNIE